MLGVPMDAARRRIMTVGIGARAAAALGILMAASAALKASPAPPGHDPEELLGTWRGTSTCADRVAAPACRDEVVVYDFTAAEKAGTVRWKADKVVDGQRLTMGEIELAYDAEAGCWSGEVTSPRFHTVWCLVVDGAHLTGTGRSLPGKETLRRIDARKD
jgi:hypothetical protein